MRMGVLLVVVVGKGRITARPIRVDGQGGMLPGRRVRRATPAWQEQGLAEATAEEAAVWVVVAMALVLLAAVVLQ